MLVHLGAPVSHVVNTNDALVRVSRTACPNTFGSETGGFRGSLYAGESGGPPAKMRSGCRVRNRGQSALAGEQIPSCVSGMSGSRKWARTWSGAREMFRKVPEASAQGSGPECSRKSRTYVSSREFWMLLETVQSSWGRSCWSVLELGLEQLEQARSI